MFTPAAHLPLAGLLLVLPALAHLRLVEVFAGVYGRLRHGFYGLRATVLMLVFLALLREPKPRARPASDRPTGSAARPGSGAGGENDLP